ncbi:carboxymuconolactone decarboxylase family protein [Dactylosporangium matsuzakiense]|uniref:Alkyl hydroperoxide reductase AhpD n=1 Tax=Dactylosporangium matsuzakiense TaxID=53360 RepID=A0A9W6KIC7_9ACTN|nr:carboxymuconolactone decarboxylase family protein [Dactylosporangium matsuzakiense]GLL00069.1 alkyl hydroperoxide reductase AhpD [Dactylosporangium matsuzakiense]
MTAANSSAISKFKLPADRLAPHIMQAMEALDEAADKVSLDQQLLELVRTRASQVNGCAFCVNAHTQAAVEAGATAQQLATLTTWREAPFYSDRERAALLLTEAVTLMSQAPVTDELWAEVGAHFSQTELAELLWAISVINVWNRIAGTAHPWPVG